MKPPRLATLRAEDSLDNIVRYLNEFHRDVITAMEGRLSVADNLQQIFKDFVIDGGDTDVFVSAPFTQPVQAVYLGYVRDLDAGAVISNAVSLDWEPATGGATIRKFHGLSGGTNYTVRLQVVGE